MINFFLPTIEFDILIYTGNRVILSNEGIDFFCGTREMCMEKIRDIIWGVPGSEKKKFVFNIKDMTLSDTNKTHSDHVYESDRDYFKGQLLLLHTSCAFEITVNSGLYNRIG